MATRFIPMQINPTVGDIAGNVRQIVEAAEAYAADEAAFLVFPELVLTGYPPEDLLGRPGFVAKAMAGLVELQKHGADFQCTLLIGTLWEEDGLVYNAALTLTGGKIRHIHKKNSLPNYGVFDERRHFAQGSAPIAFEHQGTKIGVLICEDSWFDHNLALLKTQGAEVVLIINASPFEVGKQQLRLDFFSQAAAKHGMQIVYTNLVGGQDDLVFDGASFMVDAQGEVVLECAAFESSVVPAQAGTQRAESSAQKCLLRRRRAFAGSRPAPGRRISLASIEQSIWQAIGLGLRDYVEKNRIPRVMLGLSGGIDSAVVAALAVDVLGAERVHGVLMPSEFTSEDSNQDALALAKNLGIQTSTVPISPLMDAAESTLIPALKTCGGTVENWRENLAIGGNLQARFRGNVLMAYSNALGGVVLNTSNKSEIAVGYSTMYGDACGAYSPLKDVYKTQVYALANWRNSESDVIPQHTIQKAPTAELKPAQKDSDQLPDYDVLDRILVALIEERKTVEEVTAGGLDAAKVARIWQLITRAEYKRRQFPPGPKISPMLFGKDWRYPLTSGY